MRIAFYAPMKPLSHPHPSGDQVIGRALFSWLQGRGHQLEEVSRLRSRWIYHHPWRCLQALLEIRRVERRLRRQPVDCWLTHHCYYKAPDLLGPGIAGRLSLPYVIFQPSYATKYRRRLLSAPGFYLNRRALVAADRCLSNRRQDLAALGRIVAPERLLFIPPSLALGLFRPSSEARERLRRGWQVGGRTVILTAAMFRDDVKTLGLERVLESCLNLSQGGHDFVLVIAGDGSQRARLERLARGLPPGMVRFVGRLQPGEMAAFYSAGDIFVFPGINESLGMVYLEAQACGLPVVAYDNGGIGGVVEDGRCGFLTPLDDGPAFERAIARLLADRELRGRMGAAARDTVLRNNDLERNYDLIERVLQELVAGNRTEMNGGGRV